MLTASNEALRFVGEQLKRPLPTRSITFIRSRLQDNLYLRDSDYEATLLGSSDPAMARIMLDGDFDTDFKDGILSVFKPHIWAEAVDRYKAMTILPSHAPDVIAIDAAKGGDDEMVVQVGYRISEPNKPVQYIYPPSLRIRGALVNTHELQWQWMTANVPRLLDARLYVIDIVGGAGETITAILEAEVAHRRALRALAKKEQQTEELVEAVYRAALSALKLHGYIVMDNDR